MLDDLCNSSFVVEISIYGLSVSFTLKPLLGGTHNFVVDNNNGAQWYVESGCCREY
jgi:hypothetical protein